MELFKRVDQVAKRLAGSQTKLATILGLRQKQFNGYLNATSERNLWEHLPAILVAFPDVRRDWLFFGEGEMLKSDAVPRSEPPPAPPAPVSAPPAPVSAPPAPVSAPPELVMPSQYTQPVPSQYTQPVPLVGFASCSVFGWHGTMSIPVPVEPPTWHPDMFAVMATGESMLPAGIGHGHICYCDPNKAPGKDEAVYVETSDELGTIKLFCGRSARGGGEYINLRGWLDIDPKTGTQKPMLLDVLTSSVKRIAPVMYVRRRL